MKKIILSLVVLSFIGTGCNNNTDDFNNNADAPYDVPAETLLTNAEKKLMDQMTTPEVNFSPFRFFTQYWAQTTYNDESRYRLVSRAVPDNHWNSLYRDVLGNLNSAKEIINLETLPTGASNAVWQAQQQNKLAIIEILNIYTFQVIVDTFGDVPYSESLNVAIKLPKYDDDASIYPDLITRLNSALTLLDDSTGSFSTGEYLFGGDIQKWKLFGNSLKLKLGINLADVNPTLAKSTVESAFNSGVILTNSENASFNYPGSAPNYNPIYEQLVASNRNDFVASKTLVNVMNGLSDPRRAAYFSTVGGIYVGGIYGAANNNFSSFSQIGSVFRQPNFNGQLMEATEMNFYLAEAAARGYTVGNSEEYYYNQAITASFEFWGLASQASSYLSNPSVAYATATGDWKEKIGTQAWLAFYNRPFEGWTSYRRLDYPLLVAPSNASPSADGVVPKRLFYSINERTVNTTNYQNAVQAIGGFDRMRVKVFWDVN